jgi:hypothetical protein
MTRIRNKQQHRSLRHCRRGIAIPVSFLMLFVSMILLISATYYFAVVKISAECQDLKASAAEQSMLSFEKLVNFVAWSPGSYQICQFDNFGGSFTVAPEAKTLVLSLTGGSFNDVFFNSSVGKAAYELPPSETNFMDVFLSGDSRVILNQTAFTVAQLCIGEGVESHEIALSYRPLVTSTVAGIENGRLLNSLRVYIISLNSSQTMTLEDSFRLKVACTNVVSTWANYNFTNPQTSIMIEANIDGVTGEVSIPISSNARGALVNLETVVCNVEIQNAGE